MQLYLVLTAEPGIVIFCLFFLFIFVSVGTFTAVVFGFNLTTLLIIIVSHLEKHRALDCFFKYNSAALVQKNSRQNSEGFDAL